MLEEWNEPKSLFDADTRFLVARDGAQPAV